MRAPRPLSDSRGLRPRPLDRRPEALSAGRLAACPHMAATDLLSRLHRRQHIGGVNVQLVEANVVEAEIRGRWLQRPECAIAEQLLQPRGFEDPMRAAERQRHAGNATYGLTDHVFGAEKGG